MPLSLLNFPEELQVSLHTHVLYRLFGFSDKSVRIGMAVCQMGSCNPQLKRMKG